MLGNIKATLRTDGGGIRRAGVPQNPHQGLKLAQAEAGTGYDRVGGRGDIIARTSACRAKLLNAEGRLSPIPPSVEESGFLEKAL